METAQYCMKKNPHDFTNPLIKLFFLWTIELFKVGSKDDLKIEDLFLPKKEDKSNDIGSELERQWNAEVTRCQKKFREDSDMDPKKQPKPSLLRALFYTFKWEIVFLGTLGFFNEVISRLSQPFFLGILLSYFKPIPLIPIEHALYAAGALVLINLITVFTASHYTFASYRLGMRARIAVCSLIYRKSLKLSATALADSTPGKVVNLLSNDVNRFELSAFFMHFLWLAPFTALLTLVLLFREVGFAGALGVAVVFTVVPLQSYTGQLSARFRLQAAIRTDERVRLMNEIISGVQVIKMYTWEIPFTKLVQFARKLELSIVRKNMYVRALYMSFMLFTTRAAIFCTMTSLVLQENPLTSTKVFVCAQFFAILSMTMSTMFVRSIFEGAEAWVSIHRLQDFLKQDEFQAHRQIQNINCSIVGRNEKQVEDIVENVSMEPRKSRTSISIIKGNAKWCTSEEKSTLQDINIEILRGKLVGIIGPVGSGKSSLLQAILGELNLESGSIEVNGRVSYASQEPWLFGSTVRQNILFGLPYDELRYNVIVRICSLQKDFQQFSNGDQTLVGDKGISLSGGQKARINLARAVYREADIYLLDDPLSAVDAHVGRQLYNKCVRTYLRKKTRLLVTHQLHHLTDADHIIIMRNGKIEMQGPYHYIVRSSLEYARLLLPSETVKYKDSERADYERDVSRERSIKHRCNRSRMNSMSSVTSLRSTSLSSSYTDLVDLDLEESNMFFKEKPVASNIEISSKGAVAGSVGIHYIKAATNCFGVVLAVLLFTGTQALASFFDYFVAFWTLQEEKRHHNNLNKYTTRENPVAIFPLLNSNATTESSISDCAGTITLQRNDTLSVDQFVYSRNVLMAVGGVTVILILTVGLLRAFHFYNSCIRASQTLHDLMFRGIMRSPMKFFDVTPIGRIMNRFSKDMGAVDELLPKTFLHATQQLLVMTGAVVVTSTVNPLFLAVVAALAFVFYVLRKAYLKSSKNIKRFECITRSPVFTHLSATLNGLPTIRASQAQSVIQDEFDKLQDVHTSSFFMHIATIGAFGFSMDCLCVLFVTTIILSFFVLDSDVLGDKVGLAITQAMSLTTLVQYGVRQSAEVANQLMAVERLVEYTQLPPEKGLKPDIVDIGQAHKTNIKLSSFRTPPRGWPDRGRVEFRAVSLRYGPGDDADGWALNDLSFVIQPREKVGIVGRTGAGKSSLIQAMFRLADLKGDIIIDDVNAGDVTLEDLRKHLSIIPQDPTLFSGTLRRNLDPFEEFSDDALWTVLTEVDLKESLSNPAGLAMHVQDGGANLSVGQRQLICLARALLRNNRLLMMDEATANVDPYTDNFIQQTIRTKFTDCTVLTIAHRLNTIMDSDKVMVMESGKLVEYNHPYLLLQKKGATPEEDGYFRKMVLETGAHTFSKLQQIAEECYFKKQLQDLISQQDRTV